MMKGTRVIARGQRGTVVGVGETPFRSSETVYRVRFDDELIGGSALSMNRRPWRFGPFDEPALGLTESIGHKEMDFKADELRPLNAVDALGELES